MLLADRSFYDIIPNNVDARLLCAILNCTITSLFCEIQGNAPGGSGAGVQMPTFEVRRLPVVNLSMLPANLCERLLATFADLCKQPIGPIYEEVKKPEHRNLDDCCFDYLQLTQAERDAVYEAVINLVESRLSKASSFSARRLGKRLDAFSKTQGIWAGLPESSQEEAEA
jgi:hypothetical protein